MVLLKVFQDELAGTDLVIVGSKEKNLVVAYQSQLADGTTLDFTPVESEDDHTVLIEDNEGTKWNVFV